MAWTDGATWWVMPLVTILFATALIAAGLLLVRRLTSDAHMDALSSLEHRYACGELGDEEYRRQRRLLTGSGDEAG
jgi:uncharacterized membrane protein